MIPLILYLNYMARQIKQTCNLLEWQGTKIITQTCIYLNLVGVQVIICFVVALHLIDFQSYDDEDLDTNYNDAAKQNVYHFATVCGF